MNVWVVYDTKYGNNKIIAETLAGHLKNGNSVHVQYAKEISQKAIIDGGVDMLILGGPPRFGTPSLTMKRWANKMAKMLKQKSIQLKKVAFWGTHIIDPPNTPPGQCSWDLVKQKWKIILDKFPADKKLPEIQGFVVGAIAGRDTLEDGWKEIVTRFAETIKNF